jgi:intracellular multiplication protein IcmK
MQNQQNQTKQQNPLGISKNYTQPPASGLGQTVNISLPPPPLPAPTVRKRVNKAFNDFEQSQLTTGQVKRLKKQNLQNSEASMSPYNSTPKPVTRTLMIDLSPGVNAPILRLSSGSLTSIVFSSLNGDPWYIENVKLNRNMFSDGANAGDTNPTNVLTLEPLRPIAQGNVSVMLKGLSTPVIFSLSSGQKEVDFRVDVKISGRNPDATTKVSYEERIPSIDDNVPYFLDGVPPKQAKKLRVVGGDVEAWELNNSMYIRTNADVQYPAYYSSARSTSGLAVYRFDQIYHSVTLLQNGRAYTVMIENY